MMEQMIHRPRSPPAHAPSHLAFRPPQAQNGYPPEPIRIPANPHMFPAHAPPQHAPQPSSFIPGVIPANMNPATVNFCTFSPYLPHEVKHRKRTTRTQFKVLEETFRIDSKPNLTLRKKLALQLEMSPRAVQVWFQNRRSKEKNLAKKASEQRDRVDAVVRADSESPDVDVKPHLDGDGDPRSPSEAPSSGSSSPPGHTGEPAAVPAGAVRNPLPPHAAAAPFFAASPEPDPLLSLRRGSLPVGAPDTFRPAPSPPTFTDPLARRRSVDTSLHRLAAHPYAHLARAANDGLYGRRGSALPAVPEPGGAYLHPLARRPQLAHRASMPHALHAQFATHAPPSYLALHRGSVDSTASAHEHAPPVLSARTRLLDGGLYAVSARTVSSPLPGPLPEESYTFGGAGGAHSGAPSPVGQPAPGAEPAELNAHLRAFAFPPRDEGGGGGGGSESSAASFEPPYAFESRFGSIVSVAESEASSATSAFYSDASRACFDSPEVEYPSGFHPDLRKASCASLYDGFSSLQVNPHASQDDLSRYTNGLYPTSATDDVLAVATTIALPPDDPSPVGSANGSGNDPSAVANSAGAGSAHGSAYPSPGASTVSPGHSPPALSRVASGDAIDGQLSFALTDANGQLVGGPGSGGSSGHGSPGGYPALVGGGGTPEHAFYGLPHGGSAEGLYGGYGAPGGGAYVLAGAGEPYGAHFLAPEACYLGADGKMHPLGADYAQAHPQPGEHHAHAVDYTLPYALP